MLDVRFQVKQFQSPQWGNNSKVLDFPFPVVNTSGFSPRNGEIILKAPLRNRITKPLKMHFPAEIAILKNSVNSTFQKHLWDSMVTGPAESLNFFRIFSIIRLLYKCFYKNICRPFLLSTIPYFSVTFKDFYIIYVPPIVVLNISFTSPTS